MYYVYVLKMKGSGDLYYGYTNDLERRIIEHNKRDNWILIYYEAYRSERDASSRERKLKQYGQARTHLKNRIQHSLNI
jgi:predicted GIY-YIG superfamily endonuclease